MPYKRKAGRTKKYKKRGYNTVSVYGRSQHKNAGVTTYHVKKVYALPFPSIFWCKIVYAESLTAAVEQQTYQFALNDLYDTNVTGTGAQGMYFDQLMAVYKRFCVIGAKVELRFATPTNDTKIVIRPSSSSTADAATVTGVTTSEVRPNSICKINTPNGNGVYMKAYYSIHKIWGVSRGKILDEDAYTGTSSSSPSSKTYFNITSAPMDGSSGISNSMPYNIKITYYARFSDRAAVGLS